MYMALYWYANEAVDRKIHAISALSFCIVQAQRVLFKIHIIPNDPPV